jgi:hypothetical protein
LRVQSAIQSAVTTITKTITVAAGVFAPGHLGELTWQVPFEPTDAVLADAMLAETRTAQRRLRVLPSLAGIYFVLAAGAVPRAGLPERAGGADRRAGRPGAAVAVGQGAAGPARARSWNRAATQAA